MRIPISMVAALLFFRPLSLQAEGTKEEIFEALAGMIGGKWKTEGEWSNGAKFYQEVIYEWGLGKTIIKVKTFGAVDRKGTFGHRNHGIRAWDGQEGVMRFWEFDVFGGITSGVCGLDEGSLYYEYEYEVDGATRTLRDLWTRLDDNSYAYKVGIYENGAWQSVFIETKFERVAE